MDSSSHQNWLAFSLSNHPHLHSDINPTSHHHHLSLFHPFTSHNSANVVDNSTTTATTTAEDASSGAGGRATDLAMFTGGAGGGGGPKLEDFLSGCGGAGSAAPPSMGHPNQFSADQTTVAAATEIYESELKTIAASFLRGFNTSTNDHIETLNQLPPPPSALAPASEPASKKTVDTFGQRTSIYRGVTRHRWTGRYEAHLWDNSCRREGQSRKGRQVYLGGYDKEDKAARAYDLAALKYWGPTTTTNFPVSNYEKELEEMKNMTRQEFVASLRRKSSGFSRGASIYRGVTRHHQHGRWQARIGRVAGNKDLYLGTFSTQEEAAEAYDIAAIKFRGLNAVTNFDMSRYDVKSIASSNLPIGGMSSAKSKNSSDQSALSADSAGRSAAEDLSSAASSVTFGAAGSHPTSASTLSFGIPIKQDPSGSSDHYWSNIFGFQNPSTTTTATTIAKNPSNTTTSTIAIPYFNMDHFSATSTTTTSDQSINNNGGFFTTYSHHQQQQQTSTGTGTTVPYATPIINAVNSNNLNSYESSSSNISGYGSSSSSSWNIGPTALHTFHHQTHAKPSLFQTPIFGME